MEKIKKLVAAGRSYVSEWTDDMSVFDIVVTLLVGLWGVGTIYFCVGWVILRALSDFHYIDTESIWRDHFVAVWWMLAAWAQAGGMGAGLAMGISSIYERGRVKGWENHKKLSS